MTTLREAAQQALEALEMESNPTAVVEVAAGRWELKSDLAIAALRAALAEPDTCVWQQDGDSDSGFYGTSCKRYFDLNDGTPEDNKMAWCCYCGRKLTQALITEDEDD